MIVYIENPRTLQATQIEFIKVPGFMFNIQKSFVILYTSNKKLVF